RVKTPKGKDADGAATLLACFGNFHKWANEYYGMKLDKRALDRVWRARDPIDWATLEALNVDFDERAVREEAELLEWPIDPSKRDTPPRRATKASKENAKAQPASDPREPLGIPESGRHPKIASFGEAEFVVRCEPTRVVLRVHGRNVAIS